MTILGIETSCDETSASIIRAGKSDNKVELLSNIISSSLPMHAKTGGIIPETAAREQVKYIIPVIDEAFLKAGLTDYSKQTIVDLRLKEIRGSIDAISVTIGPGLIGSLLVGVETAKVFSYVLQKPIIPVNHLFGHIYANFIHVKSKVDDRRISFPAIGLIVSGGHTDLVLIKSHGQLKWLGGTRDDAAGEAFDKVGRLLSLTYPGGPEIEKMAKDITIDKYNFPRPMIDSKDFDFSFSGLKSAVFREIQKVEKLESGTIANISYSVQEAIFEVLINKTLKAATKFSAKSILLGGGVAANQRLRDELKSSIINHKSSIRLFVPPKSLCTDNAAMIAAAAFFNPEPLPWQKVSANPQLHFD